MDMLPARFFEDAQGAQLDLRIDAAHP